MKTKSDPAIEVLDNLAMMQCVCDEVSIGLLTNTKDDPFWYLRVGDNKFAKRYPHETGKRGDVFYDANNGDRWRVLAINTEWKRMFVRNLTQGGVKLVYWE